MITTDALLTGLIGILASLPVIWAKYYSSRVTLRTDLRLLKIARDSGIDTKAMEEGIQSRIRSIYTPDEPQKDAKHDIDTVSGNLFLACFCAVVTGACLSSVITALMNHLENGIADLFVSLLIAVAFGFGTYVCTKDAILLLRRNRAVRALKTDPEATVVVNDQ
jgi:hypothetical protein